MPIRQQTPAHKPESNKPVKSTPKLMPVLSAEGAASEMAPVIPGALVNSEQNPSIAAQAQLLNDPNFQSNQREQMACQITQLQGNLHLQRVINAMPVTPGFTSLQRGGEDEASEGEAEPAEAESATPNPEQVDARVQEMLAGGERGWHQTLPRSGLRAGSIEFQRGYRQGPRLTGSYPRRPSPTTIEDPLEAAARDRLIEEIRSGLSSITAPTESGELGRFGGGYAYRARESAAGSPASAAHQEYMQAATLDSIGLDATNPRNRVMWTQFYFIINHEGDTAAINAYDSQVVSIGAGFSQSFGLGGAIFNRMPPAFRQRLYEHGICVNEDNSLTILDLNRGVVETGSNALRLLQVNPGMLSLLIQEAQAQTEMTQEETSMSERAWMLRAQFEQFLENNRDMPDNTLSWPENSLRFGLILRHWQGFLSWPTMGATNGSANAVGNYAFRAIYHQHGGEGIWTQAYIRGRISNLARDAGVGAVTFRPISTGE